MSAARRRARRSDIEENGCVFGKALVGATHPSDVDRSTRICRSVIDWKSTRQQKMEEKVVDQ